MRFTCEKCGARYSIADEKVAGKVVKMKCKKCENMIRIDGVKMSPSAKAEEKPKASAAASTSATKKPLSAPAKSAAEKPAPKKPVAADPAAWYISINRVRTGPFKLAQLKEQLDAGKINKKTFIWKKGFDGWNVIMNVPEVMDYFAGKGQAAETKAEPPKKAVAPAQKPKPEIKKPETVEAAKPSVKPEPPPKKPVAAPSAQEKREENPYEAIISKSKDRASEPSAKQPAKPSQRRALPSDALEELNKEIFQIEEVKKEKEKAASLSAEKPAKAEPKKSKYEVETITEDIMREIAATDPVKKAAPKKPQDKAAAIRTDVLSALEAEETDKKPPVEKKSDKDKADEDISDPVRQLLEAIRESDDDVGAQEAWEEHKPRTEEIFEAEALSIAPSTGQLDKPLDPLADIFEDDEDWDEEEEEDLPPDAPRESTRIFIMAAGVSKKQRVRKGFLIVGIAVAVLAGLGYAMTKFNVVDLRSLIGQEKQEVAKWDYEGSGMDIDDLFGKKRKEAAKKAAEEAAAKAAARRRAAAAAGSKDPEVVSSLSGLEAALRDGMAAREGSGEAGETGESATIEMDGLFKGSNFEQRRDLLQVAGGGGAIDISGRKGAKLSELDGDTVKRVVAANKRRLAACYESELKRDPSLRGRINIALSVKPDGSVGDVTLGRSNITGTTVESCMKKTLATWKFPEFEGESETIEFPLILSPTGF